MVIASVVMSLVAAASVMADDEVVAPVIVDQPKSVNVKAGARVTFSVNAVETTDSREDFTAGLPGAYMDMIYCAPGSFTMGSSTNELGRIDQEDLHKVTLTQGFWLGKYEVTQAQYQAIMGTNPSYFKGADLPVEYVAWEDAMEFCAKLTEIEKAAGRLPKGYEYTLPTEAQWEYACRAGTTTALNSGKNLSSEEKCPEMDEVGWYGYNTANKTHPVGQKLPNAWGLYDMHGNVLEWCLDLYNTRGYPSSEVIDPIGTTGIMRVVRGGSYARSDAGRCRSAYRLSGTIGFRDSGFRVALAPVK